MERRKVIYYDDELNDEFSSAEIKAKTIDGSYRYVNGSRFKRFTRFFWYRIIGTLIAFVYAKLVFGQKTVGREVLKKYKGRGYFLYGNHTQPVGDAFIPPLLSFPQSNYVIVHPNNVSMPVLGRITPSLGALPLPDTTEAYRAFTAAIEKRISQGNTVVIYPEAHIWPYYTHIRPFSDVSFSYPIKLNAPVFCFTNTYQKRIFGKGVRIVSYIDGPFFPDESIPVRQRKTELRNRVYACMCERAKNSSVEKIKYVKRNGNNG